MRGSQNKMAEIKLGCSCLQYVNAGYNLAEAIKSIGSIGYEGVELFYGFDYFIDQNSGIKFNYYTGDDL